MTSPNDVPTMNVGYHIWVFMEGTKIQSSDIHYGCFQEEMVFDQLREITRPRAISLNGMSFQSNPGDPLSGRITISKHSFMYRATPVLSVNGEWFELKPFNRENH